MLPAVCVPAARSYLGDEAVVALSSAGDQVVCCPCKVVSGSERQPCVIIYIRGGNQAPGKLLNGDGRGESELQISCREEQHKCDMHQL